MGKDEFATSEHFTHWKWRLEPVNWNENNLYICFIANCLERGKVIPLFYSTSQGIENVFVVPCCVYSAPRFLSCSECRLAQTFGIFRFPLSKSWGICGVSQEKRHSAAWFEGWVFVGKWVLQVSYLWLTQSYWEVFHTPYNTISFKNRNIISIEKEDVHSEILQLQLQMGSCS